ncbi:MAG: hypothetical protein MI923_27880 [Phycisphaerales bacterium]|nr:hypothetical protein [Phycisphaerales bacterium]
MNRMSGIPFESDAAVAPSPTFPRLSLDCCRAIVHYSAATLLLLSLVLSTGCENSPDGDAGTLNAALADAGNESNVTEPEEPRRSSMVQRRLPRPGGGGPPQGGGHRPPRPTEFRSIDGTDNNRENPQWGSAGVPFLRLTTVDYGDGAGSPSGGGRASAREISNVVVAQDGSVLNAAGVSDFVWQWGQFLDHDIDETPVVDPAEPFDIPVPGGDPFFDPDGDGDVVISLDRSLYAVVGGVRQQINEITAYIDASNVYGSDEERAMELRTLDGTGRLKTSSGNLLPFNENGFANAPDASLDTLFLAGDVRANEQVGLTAMHTLFVREHNYWAGEIADGHHGHGGPRDSQSPPLSGDEIYERARAIVAAEMQVITYREFLPVLLGPDALAPYDGYKPDVDAGIANVFATAAYRFGHTMLSPQLLRLDADGETIDDGDLPLAEAFFRPQEIIDHGIESLLRGLASQPAQEIDNFLIDAVRNFLFGPPGSGGFDLASLNIQRGRDHGLPSYNQVRIDYGLAPVTSFAEVNPDAAIQVNLAAVYDSVDDIDAWVGGLAEPHFGSALVGETFFTVFKDQFERLRDGDRFWYQNHMSSRLVRMVEDQTLARIIRRNTSIGSEIQDNVFVVP